MKNERDYKVEKRVYSFRFRVPLQLRSATRSESKSGQRKLYGCVVSTPRSLVLDNPEVLSRLRCSIDTIGHSAISRLKTFEDFQEEILRSPAGRAFLSAGAPSSSARRRSFRIPLDLLQMITLMAPRARPRRARGARV
ncbi:hypothetical protein EVAR_68926_1 [Eumeta japonica]|uniref:Uncharacterized protein n=1 Tax=Eumeta variegata TaxID=151549 RepID=A0A4C2AB89_EUMVA|nr:hypothetical protein EVAR_68926_1 [Eumeta japonica]